MKPVLRIPVYRRLLAAYALNELAFMIGSVALALLVYRRTGSALGATAFFLFGQFVPALISPMVVARLDQLRARAVLPPLYWLEAVIFVVLAWVASSPLLGSSRCWRLPSWTGWWPWSRGRWRGRRRSRSPRPPACCVRATPCPTPSSRCASWSGPAMGGTLVAAGGTSLALLVNAALFAASGLNLPPPAGCPEPAPSPRPGQGAECARRSPTPAARPPIRGLLLPAGVGVLFFTIVGSGRGRVRSAFAARRRRAATARWCRPGAAARWPAAAIYARWRGRPSRDLIARRRRVAGRRLRWSWRRRRAWRWRSSGRRSAGVGNGVESVAVRTALQEEVEEQWMALMMSLYEALFQSRPGVGMLIGGGITALGARARRWPWPVRASLAVTAAAGSRWPGSRSRRSRRPIRRGRGPSCRAVRRAPAVRHQ